MINYDETSPECSMTMRLQDIPENSKPTIQYDITTGGLAYKPLSKTTCRDVEFVNNSKLTNPQQNPLLFPLKQHSTQITELPPAEGFDSILVVVDQGLTKGIILIPCTKTITAEETAKLLLENLYKRFRLPDKIISNWGPQSTYKAFKELLKLLGITSTINGLPSQKRRNH